MSESAAGPRFSVIIPTFDRPRQLDACLEGLARQTTSRDAFEVIVVDDGVRAPVGELAARWADRLEITVLEQPNRGPGSARNLGASRARGEFLAFVDDDCVPDPAWLESLADSPLATGALAGGPIRNALPENPYAAASQLITTFAYRYYDERSDAERFFTANNLAIAREAFEELGGFDTSIPAATAEDKDLCDRWRAAGGELAYVPTALVWHAHHLTFRRFLAQHYGYGRGILCFRIFRDRRGKGGSRELRPEPWAFYLRLVAFPAREVGGARGLLLSGLVLLSQIATMLGALHAALLDVRRMDAPG